MPYVPTYLYRRIIRTNLYLATTIRGFEQRQRNNLTCNYNIFYSTISAKFAADTSCKLPQVSLDRNHRLIKPA
jgi:hypothetical protein